MRSVALLSLLVILGVASAIPTPHYKYDNRKVVSNDESPYFEIRWSLDSKNLRVAIVAETEDWVSLGFSADSSVEGSDGIIARIGEEGARVVDYFVPSDNSCPETICADKTLGCQDNIVVLRGQRVGGFIVVEYTRPVQGSDNCDQTISADKDHYVHWAVGAREVLGMNFQTQRFSFVPSLANLNKRSSTVEMIVLGGRELNMTIGRWFGHYTLQYWKNVDGSTVQLDADYNRQSFCTINPNAVQVAGTELVTMDGYSIYVPKTKRTIKGTTINWEVEDVQVSAGYCTTPTTDTVPCDQFNPAWPEAGTDFIPLVISTSSLADTWSAICQSNAEYEYVEQCTPSACYAVPVNFWTNSKYPDAAANTAAGFTALINQQTSVEGQTNSNTFIRVHVRQVFGREITDLTPGGREYPGNIYPVEVTDIWCGNEPWRTGIDPVPALKPCGTVKIATAPVTTSEVVTQDDFTQAVSEYINIEPEAIQVAGDSKGINGTLALTILDYRFRSGRGALDLLKLALDYNSTALQAYGIPGSVAVGDITWEEVKVTEESGAISLGVSMILLTALLAFLAF